MAEEEAGVAVVDVRVVDVEEVAAEDPSEAGAAVQVCLHFLLCTPHNNVCNKKSASRVLSPVNQVTQLI